jgi:hypothetical protein
MTGDSLIWLLLKELPLKYYLYKRTKGNYLKANPFVLFKLLKNLYIYLNFYY